MAEPLIPAYGSSTIAEIVPSLGAHLLGRGDDLLGLPAADHYVLVMVDGLGSDLLARHAASAPVLSGFAAVADGLTSGAPSTTATSLTSLGTGLTPGEHGIVGYSFRQPFSGGLLNALSWEEGLSAYDVQPRLTWFERLAGEGVGVSMVAPARFDGSGLTVAGLRGCRFLAVPDEQDLDRRLALAGQGASSAPKTLTYFYERHLDHAGHGHGSTSPEWLAVLSGIDAMVGRLRDALPDEVRILVTGDHGMVDVPPPAHLVLEDHPELAAEIDLVAGEGRLRQFYTARPGAVAARWRDHLGDDAWVRTRDEALAEGWFGALGWGVERRIGDVLVAMVADRAVMTRTQPRELNLIGMHGSLTPAEMRIPLLVG